MGYSTSSNCQNRIPEQIKSRKDWRASPKHFTGAWRRPKNQSPGMELEAKLTFQWEGFSAEGLESCVPLAVFPSHCVSYLLTHLTKWVTQDGLLLRGSEQLRNSERRGTLVYYFAMNKLEAHLKFLCYIPLSVKFRAITIVLSGSWT